MTTILCSNKPEAILVAFQNQTLTSGSLLTYESLPRYTSRLKSMDQ